MDVYRLEDGGAEDLGLDEYFDGDGVSVVEWSQFMPTSYRRLTCELQLAGTLMPMTSGTTFKPIGEHYQRLVDQLKE